MLHEKIELNGESYFRDSVGYRVALEAELERLRTIAKEHRETAEAYQNRYRRLSQAIGHISTIVQEAKQD